MLQILWDGHIHQDVHSDESRQLWRRSLHLFQWGDWFGKLQCAVLPGQLRCEFVELMEHLFRNLWRRQPVAQYVCDARLVRRQ